MKDLVKNESLEAVHARLKKEHEELQASYIRTCVINEMWRQRVEKLEKRRKELLQQKAERENVQEECALRKATDNSE